MDISRFTGERKRDENPVGRRGSFPAPPMKWKKCENEWCITERVLEAIQKGKSYNTRWKAENVQKRQFFASRKLSPCFYLWKDWKNKYSNSSRYEYVLQMYYQKDKILDYLQKVEDFTEKIREENNPEILVIKGYNNYVSFLQIFMRKLKEEMEQPAECEAQPVGESYDDICRFLSEECRDIGLIYMIPEIRGKLAPYREKYTSEEDIILAADRTAIGKILQECDEWKNSMIGTSLEEAEQHTGVLEESLKERIRRSEKDASQGEQLYSLLKEYLTDEWFEQFDPDVEENPLNSMSPLEIQEYYRNAMKDIREKILEVHRRG